jgi:hypothetical protein
MNERKVQKKNVNKKTFVPSLLIIIKNEVENYFLLYTIKYFNKNVM